MDDATKTCRDCGETKPVQSFKVKGEARRDNVCRSCRKMRAKSEGKPYEQRSEKGRLRRLRGRWLRISYGITQREYKLILIRQGGVCGICRRPGANFSRALAVDHDHRTGQIRGLLCSRCNTALGNFGDNLSGLMRAVAYLTRANDRKATEDTTT